ncbi:hypothetical protein MP228_012129 [Amoeboaphelidium protococcarum]|nr:hypothetical protein MP228_012129 [Amoeboaphelidium protococcarum]
MKFITQNEASEIDLKLVNDYELSIAILMELAGQAVAQCIVDQFSGKQKDHKILFICGPGNNGGDGLVAARHLNLMDPQRWQCTICYPTKGRSMQKDLYAGLIQQLDALKVRIVTELPVLSEFDIVVDAIFGFGFKGAVREPFDRVLSQLFQNRLFIISIDVPSGWNVDSEVLTPPQSCQISPSMVISLTAPKICMKQYKGIHYLAGRFIPRELAEQYNLILPYQNGEVFFKL